MYLRQLFLLVVAVCVTMSQNSTDDLEVRVTLLEDDVADLESAVGGLLIDDDLQDERLNTIEETVNENSNDIDELYANVDETEDATAILQQEVAILKATNMLLLQRVDELETNEQSTNVRIIDLEVTTNATTKGLTELGNVVNVTTEIVEEHEIDIQDTIVRLTTLEELVSAQTVEIAAIAQSDTEQNDRILVLEDDVDTWDDRIVALEAVDRDIQDRLVTLEETVLIPWVACVSSPCDNGGSCVDVNVDTFICMCRDGYFGMTCAESYAETSFFASFSSDPGTPGDPIVFDIALLNPEGHYDVTSGIYTVPIDGVYEFVFHLQCIDNETLYAYLEVDDVQVHFFLPPANEVWGKIFHGYSKESVYDDPFLHISGLLSLTAGQQVWVSPSSISGLQGISGTAYESWFSGRLVYAA